MFVLRYVTLCIKSFSFFNHDAKHKDKSIVVYISSWAFSLNNNNNNKWVSNPYNILYPLHIMTHNINKYLQFNVEVAGERQ